MSVARKFQPLYTIEDYSLWQGDWELWEGIAVAISPSPFGIHQTTLTRLSRLLGNAIEAVDCHAETLVEFDWIVSSDTVVRPDVIVVCGDPPDQHLRTSPVLIAETLSASTRQNDLTFKRDLYQREGVSVYLVVDPSNRSIELDIRQSDGSYRTTTAGDILDLELCDNCTINLDLSKLF